MRDLAPISSLLEWLWAHLLALGERLVLVLVGPLARLLVRPLVRLLGRAQPASGGLTALG